MFRKISDDFGGEFLGDVEIGCRAMAHSQLENDWSALKGLDALTLWLRVSREWIES